MGQSNPGMQPFSIDQYCRCFQKEARCFAFIELWWVHTLYTLNTVVKISFDIIDEASKAEGGS